MKHFAKALAQTVAPGLYAQVSASRARAAFQQLEASWGCVELTQRIVERYGPVVAGGPFEGLRFPGSTLDRHLAPKLVGAYEQELHPALERFLGRPLRAIYDVGSAEGYYAVGLARRRPETPVHAFDTDWWARRRTAEMAQLNGVGNVHIHKACTPEWLRAHLQPESLLVSDCEGYEGTLLDPDVVPALRTCDLIVETHDEMNPGVAQRLHERFAATHAISVVFSGGRRPEAYPHLRMFSAEEQTKALSEFRHRPQRWLICDARPD